LGKRSENPISRFLPGKENEETDDNPQSWKEEEES